jgi:dephospho-CoA kinase
MTTTIYGLTGGVGMGKSMTAKLFEEQGVPVVDSDVLAREVVAPGQPALVEIASQFGAEFLDGEGGLDREKMARLVFGNEPERKRLEAIIHPRVRDRWREQVAEWRAQKIPVGVVVIPLLFEVGVGDEFDRVLCVACTANTQRARLGQRGWDEAQITARIGAQMDIAEKMELADHVLWNEGGIELLRDQITRILSCPINPDGR